MMPTVNGARISPAVRKLMHEVDGLRKIVDSAFHAIDTQHAVHPYPINEFVMEELGDAVYGVICEANRIAEIMRSILIMGSTTWADYLKAGK